MAFHGTRVIVFDELFSTDQRLRGEARAITDTAGAMAVRVGGLPPEAQGVLDGLTGLVTRLERGVERLIAVAGEFGRTASDMLELDRRWLDLAWQALRGNVVPAEGANLPMWLGGRAMFAVGLARSATLGRKAPPWWARDARALGPRSPLTPVKVPDRMIFPGGRGTHPLAHRFLNGAERAARWSGRGLVTVDTFRRRLREGGSAPRVVGSTAGESASVLACAVAGAKVPGPWQVKLAGSLIAGAGCTGPGRAVGDWAGNAAEDGWNVAKDGANGVADGVSVAADGFADVAEDLNPVNLVR